MSNTGFDPDKIRQEIAKAVEQHKGWFWFTGLLSIALGTVAIIVPVVFTIAAEIFIGWLFLIGGILQSFQVFRTQGARDIFGVGVRALLAVVCGVLLLLFTGQGVLVLTILLIAFFAAEGITRIVLAFKLRPEKSWIWCLLGGIANVVFAGLVWATFPGSAAWILGLLVGIDLIFFGWSMIFLVNSAGKLPPSGGDPA